MIERLTAVAAASADADARVRAVAVVLLVAQDAKAHAGAAMVVVEAFTVAVVLQGGVREQTLPRVPAFGRALELVARELGEQRGAGAIDRQASVVAVRNVRVGRVTRRHREHALVKRHRREGLKLCLASIESGLSRVVEVAVGPERSVVVKARGATIGLERERPATAIPAHVTVRRVFGALLGHERIDARGSIRADVCLRAVERDLIAALRHGDGRVVGGADRPTRVDDRTSGDVVPASELATWARCVGAVERRVGVVVTVWLVAAGAGRVVVVRDVEATWAILAAALPVVQARRAVVLRVDVDQRRSVAKLLDDRCGVALRARHDEVHPARGASVDVVLDVGRGLAVAREVHANHRVAHAPITVHVTVDRLRSADAGVDAVVSARSERARLRDLGARGEARGARVGRGEVAAERDLVVGVVLFLEQVKARAGGARDVHVLTEHGGVTVRGREPLWDRLGLCVVGDVHVEVFLGHDRERLGGLDVAILVRSAHAPESFEQRRLRDDAREPVGVVELAEVHAVDLIEVWRVDHQIFDGRLRRVGGGVVAVAFLDAAAVVVLDRAQVVGVRLRGVRRDEVLFPCIRAEVAQAITGHVRVGVDGAVDVDGGEHRAVAVVLPDHAIARATGCPDAVVAVERDARWRAAGVVGCDVRAGLHVEDAELALCRADRPDQALVVRRDAAVVVERVAAIVRGEAVERLGHRVKARQVRARPPVRVPDLAKGVHRDAVRAEAEAIARAVRRDALTGERVHLGDVRVPVLVGPDVVVDVHCQAVNAPWHRGRGDDLAGGAVDLGDDAVVEEAKPGVVVLVDGDAAAVALSVGELRRVVVFVVGVDLGHRTVWRRALRGADAPEARVTAVVDPHIAQQVDRGTARRITRLVDAEQGRVVRVDLCDLVLALVRHPEVGVKDGLGGVRVELALANLAAPRASVVGHQLDEQQVHPAHVEVRPVLRLGQVEVDLNVEVSAEHVSRLDARLPAHACQVVGWQRQVKAVVLDRVQVRIIARLALAVGRATIALVAFPQTLLPLSGEVILERLDVVAARIGVVDEDAGGRFAFASPIIGGELHEVDPIFGEGVGVTDGLDRARRGAIGHARRRVIHPGPRVGRGSPGLARDRGADGQRDAFISLHIVGRRRGGRVIADRDRLVRVQREVGPVRVVVLPLVDPLHQVDVDGHAPVVVLGETLEDTTVGVATKAPTPLGGRRIDLLELVGVVIGLRHDDDIRQVRDVHVDRRAWLTDARGGLVDAVRDDQADR